MAGKLYQGTERRMVFQFYGEEGSNSLFFGQSSKTLPTAITIPNLGQVSARYDKVSNTFNTISTNSKFDLYQCSLDFLNLGKGYIFWYLYSSAVVTKITRLVLPSEIEKELGSIINDDSTETSIYIGAIEISNVNSFEEFIRNFYQQYPIHIYDNCYETFLSFSGHGAAASTEALHKKRNVFKGLRNPVSRYFSGLCGDG